MLDLGSEDLGFIFPHLLLRAFNLLTLRTLESSHSSQHISVILTSFLLPKDDFLRVVGSKKGDLPNKSGY